MSAAPSLAHAFLALSDDDEPPPRRSPVAAVAALVAAVALALGAPLAWLAAEHPVTALGAKAPAALVDDDG